MEILVNISNLSVYHYDKESFKFPYNKPNEIHDDGIRFHGNSGKLNVSEIWQEVYDLLVKNKIFIDANIFRHLVSTDDNLYNANIVEFSVRVDNSISIAILFEINESKFILIKNRNTTLGDIFNQIKNIVHVTEDNQIYIDDCETDHNDCVDRKLVNLLKKGNDIFAKIHVEHNKIFLSSKSIFVVKNTQKLNYFLPKKMIIDNDMLKILTKKSYQNLLENNDQYFTNQILAQNITIPDSLPQNLKDIIEFKKIQNLSDIELLNIIYEGKAMNIQLLNRMIEKLFGGDFNYSISCRKHHQIERNFHAKVLQYFYDEKKYDDMTEKEGIDKDQEIAYKNYHPCFEERYDLKRAKYSFQFIPENFYVSEIGGVNDVSVRCSTNVIQIYNNLFRAIDDCLSVDNSTNEIDFNKKIHFIKGLDVVLKECLPYLKYVVVNNSYAYKMFQLTFNHPISINHPWVGNYWTNAGKNIDYKFLKNKYFWKYLIKNINTKDLMIFVLCNPNIYGKYLYWLFLNDCHEQCKDTSSTEAKNFDILKNILSEKPFEIDYNDNLFASFVIFSCNGLTEKQCANDDTNNKISLICDKNPPKNEKDIIKKLNIVFELQAYQKYS